MKSTTSTDPLDPNSNMASQGGGLVVALRWWPSSGEPTRTEYEQGDPISINFSGGPGNPTDRIELFSFDDDQPTKYASSRPSTGCI